MVINWGWTCKIEGLARFSSFHQDTTRQTMMMTAVLPATITSTTIIVSSQNRIASLE